MWLSVLELLRGAEGHGGVEVQLTISANFKVRADKFTSSSKGTESGLQDFCGRDSWCCLPLIPCAQESNVFRCNYAYGTAETR
jgi:hypothetical protein